MLTVTDLFAGGGGSSTGAIQVPGVRIAHAVNHWPRAVEVHNANHPDAGHLCADISQIDPRYLPGTDLLWASPECTHHSIARGRPREAGPDLFGETLPAEVAERSRATMWDVPRFAEVHRYAAVVVENVVEVITWPPFRAWLMAMTSIGYEYRIVSLNSMHAQHLGDPAPQSRDRVYVVFWRRGNRAPALEEMQRPQAWCPECSAVVESRQAWKPGRTVGKYRTQYIYICPDHRVPVEPAWLPVASVIDWSVLGERIGDRARPLAEKTRARIAAGIARYWLDPMVVPVEGRAGKRVSSVADPLRTQTTRHENALARPPFIAELRGGGSTARPAFHPLSTVTAAGNHHALLTAYYGSAGAARPVTDPVGTLTTKDRFGLVTRPEVSAETAAALVDECRFRMLTPAEVALAMAFPEEYLWLGTNRERVRMAGGAVTPPAARDLIGAVVESLERVA